MNTSIFSRFWFALGGLAMLLLGLSLAVEAYAAGLYMSHSIPVSVVAMLNPVTSPLLAIALAFVWIVWTLAGSRRTARSER